MALDINLIENVGALNIATPTMLDKSPYLFRQTPSGAGNIVSPTLIGGSVGWNQLVQNGNFADSSVWTKSAQWSIANNKATFNASATGAAFYNLYQSVSTVVGHKYVACVTVSDYSASETSLNRLAFSTSFGNYPTVVKEITGNGLYVGIVNASATAYYIGIKMQLQAGKSASQSVSNINLIDLTLMLGSTIADYVYSLEQATAGSGIAYLKQYGFLSKDYYPYDAGSMQSVKTTGRQTRNSNDEIIATYPLDDIDLRGIPKLDASNNLYYDGDTYEADGSVTRPFTPITLNGQETWVKQGTGTAAYYRTTVGAKDTAVDHSIKADKLVQVTISASTTDIGIDYINSSAYNAAVIFVRTSTVSADDVDTFKAWLAQNPISAIYEKATPTTETADPYTTPQIVGATEEFLDDRTVPVPVGQESQYRQTQPYGLKIRLMEEGISIVNSSPLLRSASAPVQNTEEDTKTVKEPIEDIVKEPVDEKDTVKELPDTEDETEPVIEEEPEDDNEGTDL